MNKKERVKIRNNEIRIVLYSIVMFTVLSYSRIVAKAQEFQKACEIIVVMDCSQSMREVDREAAAFDFINGLASALPSHYHMGLVVYQQEVIASLPLGSSPDMVEDALEGLTYKQYGDAGGALLEACRLFLEEDTTKRIVWISDGEIALYSTQRTQESVDCFHQALKEIQKQGIIVDILTLGEKKTEEETIYSASEISGGVLQEYETGEILSMSLDNYLFSVLNNKAKQVGSFWGNSGEFTITLPDCHMDRVKILLLGKQENRDIVVSGEANELNVRRGANFTSIDLLQPSSQVITIHTQENNGEEMEVKAYLFSEYSFLLTADSFFQPDTRATRLELTLKNPRGDKLFSQNKIGEIEVALNGEKQDYVVEGGIALLEGSYEESTEVEAMVKFLDSGSYYYGENLAKETILIPEQEKTKPDWLFWGILLFFLGANGIIATIALRKKVKQGVSQKIIKDKGIPVVEKETGKETFYGKLVVYVIRNQEEIDYPPAEVNLFARCNRSVITLEWILDICSLPLTLKGADQVTFRPGRDKNLVVKNKGKVSVLKGNELLLKGSSYPLYYHEKITFLFDEEGAEIEVHYKDLKPNER